MTSRAVVVLLCVVMGCTSSDDDDDGAAVCGNAVCEAGESSLTCPGDCEGTATCSPANPGSCGGETICINQQCVPAFGRNYVFTVTNGVFTQRDDTGATWDAAGGLPDPLVILTINGVDFTTPAVADTLTPTWNFVTPPVLVPGGTVLLIAVYDEDLTANDLGWACQANPLTADFLRGGGVSCNGQGALNGATVTVAIRPN